MTGCVGGDGTIRPIPIYGSFGAVGGTRRNGAKMNALLQEADMAQVWAIRVTRVRRSCPVSSFRNRWRHGVRAIVLQAVRWRG
jgi:hypothetical protein